MRLAESQAQNRLQTDFTRKIQAEQLRYIERVNKQLLRFGKIMENMMNQSMEQMAKNIAKVQALTQLIGEIMRTIATDIMVLIVPQQTLMSGKTLLGLPPDQRVI